MGKLIFLCAYASFTWEEEIVAQNIVALEVCTYARKPGTPFEKIVYHLLDYSIEHSLEYS